MLNYISKFLDYFKITVTLDKSNHVTSSLCLYAVIEHVRQAYGCAADSERKTYMTVVPTDFLC